MVRRQSLPSELVKAAQPVPLNFPAAIPTSSTRYEVRFFASEFSLAREARAIPVCRQAGIERVCLLFHGRELANRIQILMEN